MRLMVGGFRVLVDLRLSRAGPKTGGGVTAVSAETRVSQQKSQAETCVLRLPRP